MVSTTCSHEHGSKSTCIFCTPFSPLFCIPLKLLSSHTLSPILFPVRLFHQDGYMVCSDILLARYLSSSILLITLFFMGNFAPDTIVAWMVIDHD